MTIAMNAIVKSGASVAVLFLGLGGAVSAEAAERDVLPIPDPPFEGTTGFRGVLRSRSDRP
jgi:hypothetical protein